MPLKGVLVLGVQTWQIRETQLIEIKSDVIHGQRELYD